MLNQVIPKLPMRNKNITKEFYINGLEFKELSDYGDYLLLKKDDIELHFFTFQELNPNENYGQVYIRTQEIEMLYKHIQQRGVLIHPNGTLSIKSWRQKEFSLLDPDMNLLTFGEAIV